MKKPWRTMAVILVVVESITQAITSPLASDIAAVVDDGSHHSKDRAEEELKKFSRIESFGKDLQQQQQQLQRKESVAGPNENKLTGFFLQEAERDEGDAYPAPIRKTAATTTTTTNGHDMLKESHYYHYRPSSSFIRATRRTENDRELHRYYDGDDGVTNYNGETTSSTEAPTATPSSAPTTATTIASSAPTLSVAITSHRNNSGYSSFFFPKAQPSPSAIIANSRDSIEFLTGAPTTTMAIRGAAEEVTTSPQTTAVDDEMTETDSSSSSSSPPPSFLTGPPSSLVSLEEPLEVDGAQRLLLPTRGLSSTAVATVVVMAAVVLAEFFPFTEIIV